MNFLSAKNDGKILFVRGAPYIQLIYSGHIGYLASASRIRS